MVKHHGVPFLEKKQLELKINESNKNDIRKILGNPSTTSKFDNDVWIYIERKQTQSKIKNLGRMKIFKNDVLVLEIDNYGILKKKTFFIDYLITKRLSKKKQNQIYTLVKKIVKLFNLKGINNIDIIDKKNKLYLIEINSRPGLSSNIIYKINKSPFIQNKKNLQNNLLATKIIYSSKQITINKKIIKFFKLLKRRIDILNAEAELKFILENK